MYAELQAQEMKLKKKEEAVAEVRVESEKKRSTCFTIEEALFDERRGVPEVTFLVYVSQAEQGRKLG
jgi:hypothetical protein